MATKTFKIGLSNTDKQNMAQDIYERILALTFPEYDTSTEYSVGDFVVYNDQLYKCIGATTGAWDSSKWQLATLNDLVSDIEDAVQFVNDKANVDGNYPTMTVGASDNLTPYSEDSGVNQNTPFLLQGTGCGNGEQQVDTGTLALLKEKQGHSVVVNQLCETTSFTFPITQPLSADIYQGLDTFNVINSHKYLLLSKIDSDQTFVGQLYMDRAGLSTIYGINTGIYDNLGDTTASIWINISASFTGTSVKVTLYVVDLTKWFGINDNIPNYLLSHPEDFFRYYQGSLAYNAGTLVNSNGRYLKTFGRNCYNPEETYNSVIQNQKYFVSKSTTITYYDKDENLIKAESVNAKDVITIPTDCVYINSSVTSITISIAYFKDAEETELESGYIDNGTAIEYPYEELANIDTGTETLRSAGSVKDTKAPDGTIIRKVGVVTPTNVSSGYNRPNGDFIGVISTDAKTIPSNELGNILSTKGEIVTTDYQWWDSTKDITLALSAGTLTICVLGVQNGTDLNTWLATNQLIVNYELATPTTEQGTIFSENVDIDDFGSMDFGGTNGVPQGALLFYAVDYKAFIDSLYNYLDGTANDVVKDSELDSKLETLGYVKLTSVTGYDATKTQVLKNVEGTLTWVTEE